MATLLPEGKQSFCTSAGIPLVGGKLYTYDAGTNNPRQTFSDAAGTIPNTNPVILDARGEATIFWDGAYKAILKDALDNTIWTVDGFSSGASFISASDPSGAHWTTVQGFINYIVSSLGSGVIGFIQAGVGAVKRWVQDKLRAKVSVEDFGAVGDGVTDDTAAILAALASFGANPGILEFERQFYKTSATILVSTPGMKLIGKSPLGAYLITANGQNFDLMRIAGSNVEVTGFLFRPGNGPQRCLNVYAARSHIHHNRFLAGNAGSNTAILLKSDDPTGTPVPGAYNHLIEFNEIGSPGFQFQIGIDQDGSLGQQANMIFKNKIVGDLCVKTRTGGGNFYIGNLLQSMTGTVGVPAGNGFDFETTVVGETVHSNYIERFQFGIIVRNNTAFSGGFFGPNHNDNNTNNVFFTVKGNSFYIDSQDSTMRLNEWQILPIWNGNWRLRSGFLANDSITVYSAINSVQVRGHGVQIESRAFASGSTVTPNIGAIRIRGNGAPSNNLTLDTGNYDGQILYLIGDSWSAQLLATNCTFAAAGVPTFGNNAGNVASMTLLYSSGENKWYEMARVVRP